MLPARKYAIRAISSALAVILLSSCAATQVALSKKDLEVQTKTSTAIFVDPVARPQRTIYVDVRSGVSDFDRRSFSAFLKEQFASNENGYVLIDDPEKAHFQLQIYVLNLEKSNPDAAHAALERGYIGGGDVTAGITAGAVIGSKTGNTFTGAAVGGLLAAGSSVIANSLVHDVTYLLVCDISIKEKVANGVFVRKDTQVTTKASDAGSSQQRVSGISDKKEYRTRIVTTANKANLKLIEAQDMMFKKAAYAMSGSF